MFTKIIKNKGFTLIEIIITTAIFVIIATMFIINLKYKTNKDALNQGIEKVITYYRQAQTLTLTGIKIGSDSPVYGIRWDTGTTNFIIFADLNRNENYDAGEETNTNCGIFDLPNRIEIFALDPVANPGVDDSLTIIFSATNTEELYFNSSLAGIDATITLENTDSSEQDSVTVYRKSGQISR